jgi:hypothetical protein
MAKLLVKLGSHTYGKIWRLEMWLNLGATNMAKLKS